MNIPASVDPSPTNRRCQIPVEDYVVRCGEPKPNTRARRPWENTRVRARRSADRSHEHRAPRAQRLRSRDDVEDDRSDGPPRSARVRDGRLRGVRRGRRGCVGPSRRGCLRLAPALAGVPRLHEQARQGVLRGQGQGVRGLRPPREDLQPEPGVREHAQLQPWCAPARGSRVAREGDRRKSQHPPLPPRVSSRARDRPALGPLAPRALTHSVPRPLAHHRLRSHVQHGDGSLRRSERGGVREDAPQALPGCARCRR